LSPASSQIFCLGISGITKTSFFLEKSLFVCVWGWRRGPRALALLNYESRTTYDRLVQYTLTIMLSSTAREVIFDTTTIFNLLLI